jgi:hypothetical protein
MLGVLTENSNHQRMYGTWQCVFTKATCAAMATRDAAALQ